MSATSVKNTQIRKKVNMPKKKFCEFSSNPEFSSRPFLKEKKRSFLETILVSLGQYVQGQNYLLQKWDDETFFLKHHLKKKKKKSLFEIACSKYVCTQKFDHYHSELINGKIVQ